MTNKNKDTTKNDIVTGNFQAKPSKRRLKLIDKILYKETDIMSFKFSRNDENIKLENYRLNYVAGQYVSRNTIVSKLLNQLQMSISQISRI